MINLIPQFFNSNFSEFEAIFTVFCIITLGIIYFVLDKYYFKPHLNKINNKDFNIQNFEIRVFFLFMSIIIILSEVIQYNFQKEVHFQILSITIALLSIILSFKYDLIGKYKLRIEDIFAGMFFIYQAIILAKIYYNGNNLVYFGTIIILFYAASLVIKKYTLYLVNFSIVFLYLLISLMLNKISNYDFYVTVACIIGVILVSYGGRLSLLFSIKKLEFSNELINNSSSLLCAFDKYGNLLYCNDAITNILGYTTTEVKGKQFWILTQDPDFIDIDYNELYQPERTYVRKLTSKSGKLHYILWSEKMIHTNLYISSGQDITVNYLQHQNYKTLFDNISEVVYEIDKHGTFISVNKFGEKIGGYSKDDWKHLSFTDIIFPKDKMKVVEYYKNASRLNLNFKPIEFRVIKKDGGYIWVSQIVNAKVNSEGKIYGFTAVARVITEEKEEQIKQKANTLKSIEYQNMVNDLYTLNLSEHDLIENIKEIINKVNNALQIDKVSIWKYSDEGIMLEYFHLFDDNNNNNNNNNKLKENQLINRVDYPNYFASMERYNSIIVNDVELNAATSELYNNYFKPNKIKSLIDHVIRINGKIDRIICFEEIHHRAWTEDEIRFTRTISNYLALIIERNANSKIEYIVHKRGKLLNSINSIYSQLIKSTNFLEIINCNYQKIGEISNVSRLFFFENKRGSNIFDLKYKWLNSTVQERTGMHTFNFFNIDDYPEIQNQFEQKGYFSLCKNDNLSESLSQLFDEINIKSLLLLPLYINNNLFGFIGLDDSKKSITWQQEDIDIFISFAKNLESVIEKVTYLNKIKESEQKFELLANNIPAGIYLLKYKTKKSSKIYFNHQMEQITGYSLNEFYSNKISLLDLYHPDDKEMAKRAIYIALKTRGTYAIKARIMHKTGKIVKIEEYGGTIVINDKIEYIEGVIIAEPESDNLIN